MTGSANAFGLKTIGGTDYTVRVGLKTPDLDLGRIANRSDDRTQGISTKSTGKGFGDDNSVDSILGPEYHHDQANDTFNDGRFSEEGKGGSQTIWVKSEVVVKSTSRD